MVQVVIAEDHHLVRQGIRALFEKTCGFQVIGEAEDGQEAVELVEKLKPDIVIMDIIMPRLNGIQASEKIRTLNLNTQIIIVSMYSDTTLIRQAFRCGVKGYLVKRSAVDELFLAIQAVLQGNSYISPIIAQAVVDDYLSLTTENSSLFNLLSSRECEVLQLIAEGHTNNIIARLMIISVKTVEKYRANIMSKLNIHDTAGLVRIAVKYGLVSVDL